MPLHNVPTVFISSTVEDLAQYRAKARDAAIRTGFHPIMQEYFVARENPPLDECMNRITEADVLVVIVAHRYGWVPADQPGGEAKSITWLECEKAVSKGKRILAFVIDEKCDWPANLYEENRMIEALKHGKATTKLLTEVQGNILKLREFKKSLGEERIYARFSTPDGLLNEVEAALRQCKQDLGIPAGLSQFRGMDDTRNYLETLHEETAWINIRGLQVSAQKVYRFPITDLYIPLTAVTAPDARESLDIGRMQPMELQEALAHRRLVIVGDPGSGKTTFLRRIAFALTDAALTQAVVEILPNARSEPLSLEQDQQAASFWQRLAAVFRQSEKQNPKKLGKHLENDSGSGPDHPFPVLIRVAELFEHIRNCQERLAYSGPPALDSPDWIFDFLNTRNREMNWGLSKDFFRRQSEAGSVILLLDGLDEAPGQMERQTMSRLFERTTRAYKNCRFVVTTRPLPYVGEATLEGFEMAQIKPLGPELVETFLGKWCQQVSPGSTTEAKRHLADLLEALHDRPEIRRMASNPVMLMALAVVHWNERKLPEGRAELYRSILRWLAYTRAQRKGREPADRCLTLLQHLALAMQDWKRGEREVQVSKRNAAEILASQFSGIAEAQRLENARAFLDQEEVDSGIIVSRGSEIRFWHLTFQEYLAARAIGGLPDSQQHRLLSEAGKILRPEWRETALLLAGVLMEQGQAKVDGLISSILDRFGHESKLSDQACCVGLLGAVIRDLRPLYKLTDERYPSMLRAVLGIFEKTKAGGIDLRIRLEAAEALGQSGDPRLRRDQNNWVNITHGSFCMGAQQQDHNGENYDPDAHEHESPIHEVRLEAYRIGRYPVTVEEFWRFKEDSGYQNPAWWKKGGFGERSQPDDWDEQLLHPNRPVVNVSWHEAAAWCDWAGGRLPTEAEWERAARGPDGRRFPWGDENPDPERACYGAAKISHPTPVGLFPRGMTPDGICDLAGNVWEWVADWYNKGYYAVCPIGNPTGPVTGKYRVVRGGSWIFGSKYLRSSFRYAYNPGHRLNVIGFRCVREAVR